LARWVWILSPRIGSIGFGALLLDEPLDPGPLGGIGSSQRFS
jgi:hypothetical protein